VWRAKTRSAWEPASRHTVTGAGTDGERSGAAGARGSARSERTERSLEPGDRKQSATASWVTLRQSFTVWAGVIIASCPASASCPSEAVADGFPAAARRLDQRLAREAEVSIGRAAVELVAPDSASGSPGEAERARVNATAAASPPGPAAASPPRRPRRAVRARPGRGASGAPQAGRAAPSYRGAARPTPHPWRRPTAR
jgi:hypothetical protein